MDLKSKKDKLSYAVGIQIGGNLMQSGFQDMDTDILTQGIKHVIDGKELLLPIEEVMGIINESYQEFKNKSEIENAAAGESFLAENKSKEGVISLASGLQYRILKEGSGQKPTATDQVTTHYEGKTIDGNIFDSSFERGEPATFPVNGVIAGWTEALQLMSVGSVYELVIPSDLAYGKQGAGADIAPNSTLIFKVELVAIN
jgi:FKBP-type peptidyl-prolyl cis-trans isomerase FklB